MVHHSFLKESFFSFIKVPEKYLQTVILRFFFFNPVWISVHITALLTLQCYSSGRGLWGLEKKRMTSEVDDNLKVLFSTQNL